MSLIYNTFIVLFEYLDLYFRSELLKRYWIALFLYSLTIPSVSAQSVLSEYVRCLDEGEDPIEYVFNLFETSDVVILGERDHRDVTQYELINKLIADHRFAERIGYVYTEVGVVNMTERANKLIKGIFRTDDEYKKLSWTILEMKTIISVGRKQTALILLIIYIALIVNCLMK